ncbi:Cyclic nucleotide-binding domain-containing protein, partial [Cynara cardunculus var. scolymus]
MAYANSRSVRFHDDIEVSKLPSMKKDNLFKVKYNLDGKQVPEQRMEEKSPPSLKSKVLSRVFSEDYERVQKKILDPRGLTIRKWNHIFLFACLISLFVDPLFFYLPSVRTSHACIHIGLTLEIGLTVVRSIADVFYTIQILIKFRTAYVAPSSRVFGRGELLLIWLIIPSLSGSTMTNTKNVLRFIIIFQYLPRLYLIFPLTSQIVEATGIVTETARAGAAYNLMLYMLASHVLGACWYLLSIEREEACWRSVCLFEDPNCDDKFFDCERFHDPNRSLWFRSSNVSEKCIPTSGFYQFGIYGEALTSKVTSALFFNKYFYCLWFGLKNLSLEIVSSFYWIFYDHIDYIQFSGAESFDKYLCGRNRVRNHNCHRGTSSLCIVDRKHAGKIRRTDTEQWMKHRQLPPELKQSVRRYDQYKWIATRGVDEESLLKDLPLDLRRDIKRHLCYDLVRRVPLFDQMDERMLDAICERLKPALSTQGTCLVREGDPVNEMLFIIRGNLDSYTTNGGRTGFFNSCSIGPGDFCGEELLTWALDPRPSVVIPSSTRTVKAISEVEAFALIAEDLKFVASQYRRLHSKQLRHKFRFYSHQWRTWAACFVQAAWRRYKRRQSASELKARESFASVDYEPEVSPPKHGGQMVAPEPGFGAYGASSRRSGNLHSVSKSTSVSALQKPTEPDFSVEEE